MKRFALFVPLLALAVVLAVTGLTLCSRGSRHAWQRLPGGGEVRLLAVTHGIQHSVDVGQVSWRDRARDAWRARSLRPLTGSAPPPLRTGAPSMSIGLWLEGRNLPASGFQSDGRTELVLPDGQTFRIGNSSWGHGPGQPWHYTEIFAIRPARAKALHWNVKLNGALLGFDAPNPAYRLDLPRWKAEPLPQTRYHQDVAVTLRSVNLKPTSSAQAPTDWEARPVWKVTRAWEPAENLYNVGARFVDPAGNNDYTVGIFSEPVWKVRAKVSRTGRFPFDENEVRWLGTIDPAVAEARTPRAHVLLPLPPSIAAGRLKLAGVFGPGEFEIKNETVISTGPAPNGRGHRYSDWDQTRGVLTVRLDRPAFVTLESWSGPTEPFDVWLFRDDQGVAAELNERWSSGGAGSLRIYDLPAKPLRIGFAQSKPFTLEFLIDAPQPPGLKKDADQ